MGVGQDPVGSAGGRRPLSRFAVRSIALFVVLAALDIAVAIIARLAAPDDPDLAVALPGVILVVGGLLAAVWGLANALEWAEAAVPGVMWLFILEGVVGTLRACASGPGLTIHVPLAAIAAAVVLGTSAGLRERRPLSDRQRGVAALLIAVVALGLAWPYAVGLFAGD